MYRQNDWRCLDCHAVFTALVDKPHGFDMPKFLAWSDFQDAEEGVDEPGHLYAVCASCGGTHGAERILSAPAEYMGEKKLSPIVSGGSFDTAGMKRLPAIPEFKGETASDFKDFSNSKELKDVKERRAVGKAQNKLKQERHAAIKKDPVNIDVRHHPVPGDPNVMS